MTCHGRRHRLPPTTPPPSEAIVKAIRVNSGTASAFCGALERLGLEVGSRDDVSQTDWAS